MNCLKGIESMSHASFIWSNAYHLPMHWLYFCWNTRKTFDFIGFFHRQNIISKYQNYDEYFDSGRKRKRKQINMIYGSTTHDNCKWINQIETESKNRRSFTLSSRFWFRFGWTWRKEKLCEKFITVAYIYIYTYAQVFHTFQKVGPNYTRWYW